MFKVAAAEPTGPVSNRAVFLALISRVRNSKVSEVSHAEAVKPCVGLREMRL